MIKARHVGAALTIGVLGSGSALAGEVSANAGITNNYVWRGLTQTLNDAAISGGIDFAADNGFYIGTWVSNAKFADSDGFSYEHDIYFGFGGGEDFTWDVGYLYYNYDPDLSTNFGEIYGSIGVGGFSFGLSILADAEPDEPMGMDFGFGQAYYASVGYAFEIADGLELGLHAGYHDGDWVDYFNFGGIGIDSYIDYNVSLSKNGVSFMISDTDLSPSDSTVNPGFDAGYGNTDIRYVISYTHEFD